MKSSKVSLLLITVGVIAIIFTGLSATYLQQIQQQNRLEEQLALVRRMLDKMQLEGLSAQQKELEEQLSQTTSQLEAAKAELSQLTESITASDTILDVAEVCAVAVTDISSSGQTSSDLAGITCLVLPLTVSVEGDVPSIISFITMLNHDFATGVVKSATIAIDT